jgi:hypothetical protein
MSKLTIKVTKLVNQQQTFGKGKTYCGYVDVPEPLQVDWPDSGWDRIVRNGTNSGRKVKTVICFAVKISAYLPARRRRLPSYQRDH